MQPFTYTRDITTDDLTAIQAYTDNQSNNFPAMAGYDPVKFATETLDNAIQSIIDKGNSLETDGIKRDLISQIQSMTTTDELATLSEAVTTTVTEITKNRKTPPIEIKPGKEIKP